jgi:hypothetical protein
MADEQPKVTDEAALAGRIEGIETRIRNFEVFSRRAKIAQRIGMLLILGLLLLFVYRIYAHFHGYAVAMRDSVKREALLKEFLAQAKPDQVLRTEAQALVQDIQNKVLPKLFEDVVAEFNKSKPELEQMATEMGSRLTDFVKTTVADRLREAMLQSYNEMEAEIRKSFGDMPEAQFKKDFDASRDIFIQHFMVALDERLGKVQTGLEGLKETVRTHYGKDFAANLSGEERARHAEMVFIESLIDLIVYELKPELGDEPFRQAAK